MFYEEPVLDEKSVYDEKPLLRVLRSTLLCAALAVVIVPICYDYGFAAGNNPPSLNTAFSAHWQRPLDLTADNANSPGLLPADCKLCHPQQYAPWSRSLHSKTTGPGLMGQLSPDYPDFASSCYFCHAPAKKQNEDLLDDQGFYENTAFDKDLQDSGVSCAICHLRNSIINGPTGSTTVTNNNTKSRPHQNAKNPIFKDSIFCSACHQLDGGFELNGKSLTNTYKEWLDSPYPAQNIHCQSCHMPEGKHLFLGIHDKATVRGALDIKIKSSKKGITLTLKNTGAGHYLPTYVTPLIIASGHLIDSSGNIIKNTLEKDLIGRVVKLDLSEEIMDSRIAPGVTHTFKYQPAYPKTKTGPLRAVIEVRVYPDEFYNRFFKEALKAGAYTSKALMQEALEATEQSPYLLFRGVRPF